MKTKIRFALQYILPFAIAIPISYIYKNNVGVILGMLCFIAVATAFDIVDDSE